MEALALRLSHLDSQAEGAIRVVMFYDTLMRRRVDLPALARASAGLAECVAGIRLHGTGRPIRSAPTAAQRTPRRYRRHGRHRHRAGPAGAEPLAAAMLVAFLTALQTQVRLVDEPYLYRVHGTVYDQYAARTGRFLPWIGRQRTGTGPA